MSKHSINSMYKEIRVAVSQFDVMECSKSTKAEACAHMIDYTPEQLYDMSNPKDYLGNVWYLYWIKGWSMGDICYSLCLTNTVARSRRYATAKKIASALCDMYK